MFLFSVSFSLPPILVLLPSCLLDRGEAKKFPEMYAFTGSEFPVSAVVAYGYFGLRHRLWPTADGEVGSDFRWTLNL